MKKLITICALVVALGSMSFAQNRWNFAGYFPDSTQAKKASGIHGLAVDPAGRIWAQWFGRTDSVETTPGVLGALWQSTSTTRMVLKPRSHL